MWRRCSGSQLQAGADGALPGNWAARPRRCASICGRGGWQPYGKPCRNTALDGQLEWLRQRFLSHRGNADVVRQELASEKGILVSLRTVERAVEPWRRELRNAALATVRFETPPGKQLQADFGQCLVSIGGERVRVHGGTHLGLLAPAAGEGIPQ